jgi:hypothetical protein
LRIRTPAKAGATWQKKSGRAARRHFRKRVTAEKESTQKRNRSA